MALITGSLLVAGSVLGFLLFDQVATLVHWLTIAGGVAVYIGLVYNAVREKWLDFLGFDSQVVENFTVVILAVPVAVLSSRVFEAAIGTLGVLAGLLVVIGSGAVFFFGLSTVASTIITLWEIVETVFEGEN